MSREEKGSHVRESERRKGLLYSRREQVGMAWNTDVGCGHMDMGRTDKGPRPGNFKASRGRSSSSQDLYVEGLSSRQESSRMTVGTIP